MNGVLAACVEMVWEERCEESKVWKQWIKRDN